MLLRNLAGSLLILLLLSCSGGEPGQSSSDRTDMSAKVGEADSPNRTSVPDSVVALEYEVIDQETYDAPIKTQVLLHAIITGGELSEPGVRETLQRLYNSASSRSGFDYHDRPTHVAAYLYTSRDHFESGMGQWVGMVSRIGPDGAVETDISEALIQSASAPKESRFGLSEDERRQLFREIVAAEDRAWADAEDMHPLPDPATRNYSADRAQAPATKQAEAARRLTQDYKADLAADHSLSMEQLKEVGREGMTKNWPMP